MAVATLAVPSLSQNPEQPNQLTDGPYLRNYTKASYYASVNPDLEAHVYPLYAVKREMYGFGYPEFLAIIADALATEGKPPDACSLLVIDDLVLARACANGNEEAWAVLFARYEVRFLSWARRIGYDLSDDAISDFCGSLWSDLYRTHGDGRVYSQLAYYNGIDVLDPWLKMVLKNKLLNWLYRWNDEINQHTGKRVRTVLSLEVEQEANRNFDVLDPREYQPNEITKRIRNLVADAVTSLPEAYQFVLAAYYIHERTTREIDSVLRSFGGKFRGMTSLRKKSLIALRDALIFSGVNQGLTREQIARIDLETLAYALTLQLQSIQCVALPEKSTRQEYQDNREQLALGPWREACLVVEASPEHKDVPQYFYECQKCGWTGYAACRPHCKACNSRRCAERRRSRGVKPRTRIANLGVIN